jgi:hypothetical protein
MVERWHGGIMAIPGRCDPYLRTGSHLGQDAQQTASPRGDLNTELHFEGIGPVLVEGLPHRCDYAPNRLRQSRQAQHFGRRRDPLRQPNIRRASGLPIGGC